MNRPRAVSFFRPVLLSCSFCFLLFGTASFARQDHLTATGLTDRFLAREPVALVSYRARRHLEAGNVRFKKHASLDVLTELGPGGWSYTVMAASGSEYVLRRVLFPALEREKELVGRTGDIALSSANYTLADDGFQDGVGRIKLTPKRKDPLLVDGWLFVSADAEPIELRGRLIKMPSFWTTRVTVVRQYDRIAGVSVPVRLASVASVRFAGESTFSMRMDYEAINGAIVE